MPTFRGKAHWMPPLTATMFKIQILRKEKQPLERLGERVQTDGSLDFRIARLFWLNLFFVIPGVCVPLAFGFNDKMFLYSMEFACLFFALAALHFVRWVLTKQDYPIVGLVLFLVLWMAGILFTFPRNISSYPNDIASGAIWILWLISLMEVPWKAR